MLKVSNLQSYITDRDTITDLSSKAFDSTDKGNRKISSNMTYSTDMTENGTRADVEVK